MSQAAERATKSLSEFVADATAGQDYSVNAVYENLSKVHLPGISARSLGTGVVGRVFDTAVGGNLFAMIGNETRTAGVLGMFAVDVVSEIIALSGPPAIKKALEQNSESLRQIAVFGENQHTDLLILLPPELAPKEPLTILSSDHTDPGLIDAAMKSIVARSGDLPKDSPQQLLYGLGTTNAAQALWAVRPHVVAARAPKMEQLSVPVLALNVLFGKEESSVGAFARDGNGQLGVTVAYHATGGVGTQILVDGEQAVIAAASMIFDTSFARLPEGFSVTATHGKKGPMTTRPPWEGEPMTFFGVASRNVTTYGAGADKGIPLVDPTRMRCIQTKRDTNPGDSGAALVNGDDEIVGFAYRRSEHDENPAFSDWVWARSVFDAFKLQPL